MKAKNNYYLAYYDIEKDTYFIVKASSKRKFLNTLNASYKLYGIKSTKEISILDKTKPTVNSILKTIDNYNIEVLNCEKL